jgi:putative FmdB family regulatory protein
MPLYEYECKACGEKFEKRVSFSQADETQECPACRSAQTRKRVSTFASLGGTASGGSYGGGASSCGSGGGGFT